jgi:hypothetical protein
MSRPWKDETTRCCRVSNRSRSVTGHSEHMSICNRTADLTSLPGQSETNGPIQHNDSFARGTGPSTHQRLHWYSQSQIFGKAKIFGVEYRMTQTDGCPLWVRLGSESQSASCPLSLWKRTPLHAQVTSVLCHYRKSPVLRDHLVGALELKVVDLALPAPCARRTGQGLN